MDLSEIEAIIFNHVKKYEPNGIRVGELAAELQAACNKNDKEKREIFTRVLNMLYSTSITDVIETLTDLAAEYDVEL